MVRDSVEGEEGEKKSHTFTVGMSLVISCKVKAPRTLAPREAVIPSSVSFITVENGNPAAECTIPQRGVSFAMESMTLFRA